MNAEKTKQAIEVMKAYLEGKQIQIYCRVDGWEDVFIPSWDWLRAQYRVKPKPKELWVHQTKEGHNLYFHSEEDANWSLEHTDRGGSITHYREVIE